ncbi:MAG: Nif3-like dinuclear metal center hexameric protein [Bacteroidales bacterium]|nr:Nif3-like dinuclear metal center hexameric protein [Bacteroidales bacterium]
MKVKEIMNVLEEFAGLGIQEKWDNSGLCIGDPEMEATGVLLGMDCSVEMLREARAKGANMVVTHHPLIFHGLKQLHPGDPVAEAVMDAVKNDMAVFALHTPADKVIGGVSWLMAQRLGLQDIKILDPEPAGVGLGAVGNFPEPVEDPQELIALVKSTFELQAMRCSAPVKGVRRVALCGGSGSDMIETAMAAGAQAYISADFHYHHFFTPSGFMIMDIGHYEGEKYIVKTLYTLLKKNFPTFAVQISERQGQNPVRYY